MRVATTPSGLICSVADLVTEFKLAEITSFVFTCTLVVVTLKVADVAPAATVTEEGPLMEESPPLRVTVSPCEPAAPLRVTVPVDPCPPNTEAGEKVTADTAVASTVSVPFALEGPIVAVSTSGVVVSVWLDVTVKFALEAPAAMFTVAG